MREQMFYNAKSDRVVISAAALSAFAVRGRGIPFTESDTTGTITGVSVPLELDADADGCPVRITAAADMITATGIGDALCLTVSGVRRTDKPEFRFAESAMLAVAGYLRCVSEKLDSVILRLTLSSGNEDSAAVYEYRASISYLRAATDVLLARAQLFIRHTYERGKRGIPAMRELPFPYRDMRESQYDFINEAFRAIKASSRLLVSAPTGTGKTIAALYPSVRAIGAGFADKVFCLCAKTTIGKAFTDAAALLGGHVPELRCVVISSKERCCPIKRQDGGTSRRLSGSCGRSCPLCAPKDKKGADLRLIEAAAECLSSQIITADVIRSVAETHSVCPHELSLSVSEYCDIVICDYNYVFDFRIRLRRYFGDASAALSADTADDFTAGGRYIFLADEVHNLPKRAADTYSAELSVSMMRALLAETENLAEKAEIAPVVNSVISELDALAAAALADGESHEMDGRQIRSGFVNSPALPEKLAIAAGTLRRALGSLILRYEDALAPIFSEAADTVGKFCHVCSLFDGRFTCFSSAIGDEFYVRLCCLDPSVLLDRAMRAASAVIFFSATLTPMPYYSDILGCTGGAVLELDSPFPPENLCPVAFDGVSMKMSERAESVDTVAECILAAAESRPGNYLAFFPSFDYMEKVLKSFRQLSPETPVIVQSRSMRVQEREKFLSALRDSDPYEPLIGFAVLGGIFSEGIDLPGDSLIGVIIAGTGMPQITSERNIMKEFFDKTRESGTEYAYIYPGFNNVLQAAGRVIRTDTDRGILILIDSRYSEPTYYRLFPKYWRHIKYTGDPFSLEEILRRFWENE